MRSSRNPDAFLPRDFIGGLQYGFQSRNIPERSRMNTAGWSENLPAALAGRRHQMFPELSDADIARIRRFGSPALRARATPVHGGRASPGMFVVLKGVVAISQRDGLGACRADREQGPGQFLGGDRAAVRGPRWSTATPRKTSKRCWCRRSSCAR